MSCNVFPTLTSTIQSTGESLITTSTASLTTGSPTIVTSTTVLPCPTTLTSGTCIPSTVVRSTTIPGEVQTVQVPITVTVPITATGVTTLYGSSCAAAITTPDAPPPTQAPTTTTPIFTPTTITSESYSTQANGSVIVQTIVVTSTQPTNSTIQTQTPKKGSSTNVTPIVGGAVGGLFGLLVIVAFVWFLLKRRRRWDDIFDEDKDNTIAPPPGPNRRFSIDASSAPKPYEYGLVGKATAPLPASPPHSPGFVPNVLPPGAGMAHAHGRTPSMAPLLSSTTTHSSRPSTGGSANAFSAFNQQPLQPMQPMQPMQPIQPMQPMQPMQPLPIQRPNELPGPGPNAPSNTHSNLSYATPALSVSNYSASVSGAGSEFNRTGSPTSIAEPRILHVTNAHPGTDGFMFSDPFSSSSSSAAAAAAASSTRPSSSGSSHEPQRDGKGRLRRPSLGKAPMVHLDGGRVQQQLEAATSTSGAPRVVEGGPAPPAYEA